MNLRKIIAYIIMAVFIVLVFMPINIENTEIAAHIGNIKILLICSVFVMLFFIGVVGNKIESIIASIMFMILSMPLGHVLINDTSIKQFRTTICEYQVIITKEKTNCIEATKPNQNSEKILFTFSLIVMSLLLTNQYIVSTRKVNLLLRFFDEEEHSTTDEEQIETKGRVASLVEKANTLCESPAVRVTVFIVGSILVLLIAFMLMYHASVKEGDNLNIKTKEIITTKI